MNEPVITGGMVLLHVAAVRLAHRAVKTYGVRVLVGIAAHTMAVFFIVAGLGWLR